jgi:hypothetical protein
MSRHREDPWAWTRESLAMTGTDVLTEFLYGHRFMHIHLLGGSNTGIWNGWAHHFVIMAERDLGARVTNGFLGAVGSLYGLLQLQKLAREGAPLPDAIVFEYALNDIVLVHGDVVSLSLVRETLTDVCDFCVRRGVALQLLCLEPKELRLFRPFHRGRRVRPLYGAAALRHGLPSPLSQSEAMGRNVLDGDYLDDHHLTPEASRLVAEALVRRLSAPPPAPVGARIPRAKSKKAGSAFDYVDATEARVSGRARPSMCDMTILKGPVVELRRPSSARWPATGRLVGVLLRARPTSGWYRITVAGAVRRKNACGSDLALLPEVVTLHYPHVWRRARGAVEVAMPDGEDELMRLAEDVSPMPQDPEPPFADQEMAVFGVMLWRGPSGLLRVAEAIDFWRRSVVRAWPRRRVASKKRTAGELR